MSPACTQTSLKKTEAGTQSMTKPRRLPPPWTVLEIRGGFRIEDADGKAVAYVYGLDPRELPAAGHQRLTLDEARRVAANIAKLPDLLKGSD